jgi:hypothetical protein
VDDFDPVDARLPKPPISIASLTAYVNSHAEGHERLVAWHDKLHATRTALVSGPSGWTGPDSDAFQGTLDRLRERQIQPVVNTMGETGATLASFRQRLLAVRDQARADLHRADAHLERAEAWKQRALLECESAQAQLVAAEAALEAAVAAASAEAATLVLAGAAAAEVQAAEMAVQAAQARLMAAREDLARAEQDVAQAHQEQEQAKLTAREHYAAADQQTAARLAQLRVPAAEQLPAGPMDGVAGADGAAAGAAANAGGIFADCPLWTGPGVPMGAGQPGEYACLAAGEQNLLHAAGVEADSRQIGAEIGLTPAGGFYANTLPSINTRLRQNPAVVARLVGQDTPRYRAVMAGDDLVTFQEGVTIDQLSASTARGLPSLVPIRTEIDGLHNVTVYGVRNGNVYLLDSLPEPAGEARIVPVDRFMHVWDRQRATLLVA